MPASPAYTAITNIITAIVRGQQLLLTEDRARITTGLRELQGASDADGSAGYSAAELLRALDGLALEVVCGLREYPAVQKVRAEISHLQACRGALRQAIRPRPRPAGSPRASGAEG